MKGKWICPNCGNTEDKEREIMCWKCGKGEMIYTRMTTPPLPPEITSAEEQYYRDKCHEIICNFGCQCTSQQRQSTE